MKRTYITHVTRDYLEVAINLAKSLEKFSNYPLIVYCVNLDESDKERFRNFSKVILKSIDLDIKDSPEDYLYNESGNFYVNRSSSRIYKILCAKTIAMEMSLEEGWEEVCYLDSDCLATPLVDELFEWTPIIKDYPIATEGIHDYMIIIKNGFQVGNPFGETWPVADNTKSLEWPLMSFLEMSPESRGKYRTTGIMLMNQNCLPFIKTWREFCFILPKLVDLEKYAPYHEETIYNVLSWKKTNEGFPLCYVNIGEGLETVKHIYSGESKEGELRWSEEDPSQRFYMIPESKKNIKVLHGEKRTSEVNLILDHLKSLRKETKILIQVDTYIQGEETINLTKECLKRVKNLGYPVLLTSHSLIPEEISNLADFVEIDECNPILEDTGSVSFLNYFCDQFQTSIKLKNSDPHAPACLTSIINGAKFALNNGFEFFLRIEYDTIFKHNSIEKIKDLIHSSSKTDGLIFTNGGEWIDGKFIFLKPESYLRCFDTVIRDGNDYLNFLKNKGVPDKDLRHLQVAQYKILSGEGIIDKITKESSSYLESIIDKDLGEIREKEVGLFRPGVLKNGNGEEFATIAHGLFKDLPFTFDLFINGEFNSREEQSFLGSGVTYKIFPFSPGSQYQIVYKHPMTENEEKWIFSSLTELSEIASIELK